MHILTKSNAILIYGGRILKELIRESGDLRTEHHINGNFPLSIHIVEVYNQRSIYPHYHDNYEIVYLKTGSATVRVGNHIFQGEENDFFFSNKFQVHSVTSEESKKSEIYAIVFDQKIIEELNHNLLFDNLLQPLFSGVLRFPEKISKKSVMYDQLLNSIQFIIEEYYRQEKGYELFIKTEVERIFGTIIRYSEKEKAENSIMMSLSDKKIVEGTWLYINRYYNKKISLDQMAKNLNISKHYYCRLIKKLTGKTFTQLLNMYRVQQAKMLIETTRLPIFDIIEKTGFSNQSYFNKMYSTYIGHTPIQSRKNQIT